MIFTLRVFVFLFELCYIIIANMNGKKITKIKNLLVILIIFIMMFGCVMIFNSLILNFEHTNMNMGSELCCDMSGNGIMAHLQSNLIMTDTFNKSLLIFLIVLLINKFYLYYNFSLNYYFYKIRDRYGGWQIFNYFISLFKNGILHPKVY